MKTEEDLMKEMILKLEEHERPEPISTKLRTNRRFHRENEGFYDEYDVTFSYIPDLEIENDNESIHIFDDFLENISLNDEMILDKFLENVQIVIYNKINELGISYSDIAKYLAISEKKLNKYLENEKKITLDILVKIFYFLKLELRLTYKKIDANEYTIFGEKQNENQID